MAARILIRSRIFPSLAAPSAFQREVIRELARAEELGLCDHEALAKAQGLVIAQPDTFHDHGALSAAGAAAMALQSQEVNHP